MTAYNVKDLWHKEKTYDIKKIRCVTDTWLVCYEINGDGEYIIIPLAVCDSKEKAERLCIELNNSGDLSYYSGGKYTVTHTLPMNPETDVLIEQILADEEDACC